MKTVTVTNENFNWVYGRLNRFFKHKDFLMWHQFSGGMRKRIGHHLTLRISGNPAVDVMREYKGVNLKKYNFSHHEKSVKYTQIILNDSECLVIEPDDKIAFLGNRIIIKQPFQWSESNYVYYCLQILK